MLIIDYWLKDLKYLLGICVVLKRDKPLIAYHKVIILITISVPFVLDHSIIRVRTSESQIVIVGVERSQGHILVQFSQGVSANVTRAQTSRRVKTFGAAGV